jgi:hypothetical protein
MRTLALLFVLIALAASQPHAWLYLIVSILAH